MEDNKKTDNKVIATEKKFISKMKAILLRLKKSKYVTKILDYLKIAYEYIKNILLKIKHYLVTNPTILKTRDFIVKYSKKGFELLEKRYPALATKLKNYHKKIITTYNKIKKWITEHEKIKKNVSIAFIVLVVLYILYSIFAGPPRPQIRQVSVAGATKQTVPVYISYVGLVDSIQTVDIRARVKGFLIERNFVEGDDVKENELTFVIDPREYLAALDNTTAELVKSEAALKYAKEQVERYKILVEKEYVTREFYDQQVTQYDEALATVEANKASVEKAKLNLGYCKMYSPLNGRIGKTFVNIGNLVGDGQDTKLATIVQLNPIYVYFNPSESALRTFLQSKHKGILTADLFFDDGTKYGHEGKLDFVNNVVDVGTSTVKMRVVVSNPDKILLPGTYVNLKLLVTEVPNTILVPEIAVAEDQGGNYVYIVKPDNIVEERRVTTGTVLDGMRIIKKGVEEHELVMLDGMQLVHPGSRVLPKLEKKEDTKKDKATEKLDQREDSSDVLSTTK